MKRFLSCGLVLAVVCASPQGFAQDWIPLQDGKTMAGWQAAERPESWAVENGEFVSHGERAHLFYVGEVANHDFRNFELLAEVKTIPGTNSGIYVHTRLQGPGWPEAGYEMQVINSNPPAERMGGYIEHKMTGSIYAVRNTWKAPAPDNQWFTYRIRVVGKTIQTFINNRLICEYAEPADPYRPDDKKGRLLGSGTFALQAHDPGSSARFRHIKVRILPDNATPPADLVPLADRELDQLVTQASNDNIPLIDLGLSPPAGNATAFWSDVRRHGMTPGSEWSAAELANYPPAIMIIVDRDRPPSVDALKAAKAAGVKVAFSSGGATSVDEARLKARLQAIRDAGLGWKDFWVPGK